VVNGIVYAEYNNQIAINSQREVITDYLIIMIGRVYALQLQHEANSANDIPPSAPIVDVITEYLYQDIIEDLETLIFGQVHQDCEGCKVNHPSQLRHQLCLFFLQQKTGWPFTKI